MRRRLRQLLLTEGATQAPVIETRLTVAPQDYGKPLRKTLKGYWKLRVGDYRIVFKIQTKEILILGILNRKDVYGIIEKYRT